MIFGAFFRTHSGQTGGACLRISAITGKLTAAHVDFALLILLRISLADVSGVASLLIEPLIVLFHYDLFIIRNKNLYQRNAHARCNMCRHGNRCRGLPIAIVTTDRVYEKTTSRHFGKWSMILDPKSRSR